MEIFGDFFIIFCTFISGVDSSAFWKVRKFFEFVESEDFSDEFLIVIEDVWFINVIVRINNVLKYLFSIILIF